MKTFSRLTLALLVFPTLNCFADEITNGVLSESQKVQVERFLGAFSARDNSAWSTKAGSVIIAIDADNRLTMKNTMDVTGRDCESSIGAPIEIRTSDGLGSLNESVNIIFQLDKNLCPEIAATTVTLHYNEALTHEDIYEVEVLINAGSHSSHGNVINRKVKTWVLEKNN